MTVEGTDNSTQVSRSEVGDPGNGAVEKNQPSAEQGLASVIEPGAPKIVLTILILAAIGILAFAFSSCF